MPTTIPTADSDTHDLDDDHDLQEGQAPKIQSAPMEPTPEEIEAHAATHVPYRSWCNWCKQDRQPNQKHIRSQTQRDIHLLVGDYCFVRDSRDQELLTPTWVNCTHHLRLLRSLFNRQGETPMVSTYWPPSWNRAAYGTLST